MIGDDSEATVHVCNDKTQFKNYEEVVNGQKVLMGNHDSAKVVGKGSVELNFTSGKKLLLVNVLYVPEIRKNLVSASLLCKKGYKAVLESDKIIVSINGLFVGKVKDCPEIPCNIKILTLDYTGIEQLPSSIKHLSQLVTLSLNECTELVSLPSSIGNLKRLEQLNLVGCSRLVTIPSSIGELKCLEKLLLFRCSNLASLPESIKQLSKLKQLDLSICESLKILPELPSCLECLVAGNCPSLESASISFHFSEHEDENEEADKSEDENEEAKKSEEADENEEAYEIEFEDLQIS
ncbi:hypothetical protein GH714_022147 [Hevea brasiliensis]|uniref:Uncharacterized protein n=1 Tax=Hevea brasiliensis TaxID=3981 RepID=A0A6A6N1E7_HEVBR|nr:hypothetical protein GH714_022147 [Hevea brasiliensis]